MTRRIPILYRWWDAEGNILYVGKSIAVLSRAEAHRNRSEFFNEAVMMTMERYPDELTLAEAEVAAIVAERPPYNVAHNRGYDVDYDFDFEAVEREALKIIDEMLAPAFAVMQAEVSS